VLNKQQPQGRQVAVAPGFSGEDWEAQRRQIACNHKDSETVVIVGVLHYDWFTEPQWAKRLTQIRFLDTGRSRGRILGTQGMWGRRSYDLSIDLGPEMGTRTCPQFCRTPVDHPL
jgi:Tfp pilus assembly protein FimT